MTVKHSRTCGTCQFSIYMTSNTSPTNKSGNHCTNPQSKYHNQYLDYYTKGRECHSKVGDNNTLKTNDYIEYQQGVVKLKLQNGQMTLQVNATTHFNEKERAKIEKDLSDVFEVVTLASSKIVKESVKVAETVEI